jgi:uroporphyrinogen decarboxylase
MLAILCGQMPDRVPAAPDTSNMIPAKLTGKPFWDIYLFKDPPQWLAYLNCVKHFGIDSLMDGFAPVEFEDLQEKYFGRYEYDQTDIVFRSDDRIVTQNYYISNKKRHWDNTVDVYYRDNPPTRRVNPNKIRLPSEPEWYAPLESVRPEGVKTWPVGEEMMKLAMAEMGSHGVVGCGCGTSLLLHTEEEIYDFYDNPQKYDEQREMLLEYYEKKFERLMAMPVKPDFISTAGSGTLTHQSLEIFRRLALPIVKKMTALAKKHGIPTHIHSCGPEKELVKICAEETDLTLIDPLEIPPMGDCDLKEIKKRYGNKLALKGNLHTTRIMLHGSVSDVVRASKQAIDDAGDGGGFILSTGDQCGRDTPYENIAALIDTAKTYGRY